MGSQSWGSLRIPAWAMRYPDVQALFVEFAGYEDIERGDGVCRFASGVLVYNDTYPKKIHETLQRLGIPYDFDYTLEAYEQGEQSGGWRPGMPQPLEFSSRESERTFTASQLRTVLIGEGSPRKRLGRLRALLDEEARLLTPLAAWPDPRAEQSATLRSARPRAPRVVRRRRPAL